MWFHLLSLAAFVALGSCLDYYGYSRAMGHPDCKGPGCTCNCPRNSCPPCPTPQLSECLNGCGMPSCPCLNANENPRSDDTELGKGRKLMAKAISTVSVYPTGPICSAFNVLPNMMVTVNTCVAGKALRDLYVTLHTPRIVSLKVVEILNIPYNNNEPSPVLLITEKPNQPVNYFALPPRPIDEHLPAEIHKWEVVSNGWKYTPTRTKVKSHKKCLTDSGKDLICVEAPDATQMGWNDIGTPLLEIYGNNLIVQGMYIGHDLYIKRHTIKYLALYKYTEWLYKMVEKYY